MQTQNTNFLHLLRHPLAIIRVGWVGLFILSLFVIARTTEAFIYNEILTSQSQFINNIQFTPDGETIVFRAFDIQDSGIVTRLNKRVVYMPANRGQPPVVMEGDDFSIISNTQMLIENKDSKKTGLSLVTFETGEAVQILDNDHYILSPDKSYIIFLEDSAYFGQYLAGGEPVLIHPNYLLVENTTISPDNRYVLFFVSEENGRQSIISVSTIDGSTTVLHSDWFYSGIHKPFKFSRDGAYVIYQTRTGMYRIPIEGGDSVRIDNPDVAGYPHWRDFLITPDNEWVIFIKRTQMNGVYNQFQLRAARLMGTGQSEFLFQRTVLGDDVINNIQVSPDSGRVLFTGNQPDVGKHTLFSVDLPRTEIVQLSPPLDEEIEIASYEITSNGEAAIVKLKHTNPQFYHRAHQLYSVPIVGGEGVEINNGELVFASRLSENGSRIAYAPTKLSNDWFASQLSAQLFSESIDGTDRTQLNLDRHPASEEFYWSPSGDNVAFVSQHYDYPYGAELLLYRSTADGGPLIISQPSYIGYMGQPYLYEILFYDRDPGPAYTLEAPDLPDWLTLIENQNGTATLSGSPTTAGTYFVELLLTENGSEIDRQSFTIFVSQAGDFYTAPNRDLSGDLYTQGYSIKFPGYQLDADQSHAIYEVEFLGDKESTAYPGPDEGIYSAPLDGSRPPIKLLPRIDWRNPYQYFLTPNGDSVISLGNVDNSPATESVISIVAVEGGETTAVHTSLNCCKFLGFNTEGDRLIWREGWKEESKILMLSLSDSQKSVFPVQKLDNFEILYYELAPDGEHLVFNAEDLRTNHLTSLFAFSLEDGSLIELGIDVPQSWDRTFTISPDGQTVIFEDDRGNVKRVSINGGEVEPLLTFVDEAIYSDWIVSWEESALIFYGATVDVDFGIFKIDLESGEMTELVPFDDPPAWGVRWQLSPDGKRIVYRQARQNDLNALSVSDGVSIRLANPYEVKYEIGDFMVSPDSEWVVFDYLNGNQVGLAAVPLSGGPVVDLSSLWPGEIAEIRDFKISPDSQRVAFWGLSALDSNLRLYSMPIEGGMLLYHYSIRPGLGPWSQYDFVSESDQLLYVSPDNRDDERILELFISNTIDLKDPLLLPFVVSR